MQAVLARLGQTENDHFTIIFIVDYLFSRFGGAHIKPREID